MNKGKRIGLIVGASLVSIIVIVICSIKVVKSNAVKESVVLGNKYIAEGNYKESILAFQKAISIDGKNQDVVDSLMVLYDYEKIDNLITEGKYDEAKESLETIKDKPKFDIIKDVISKAEEIVEENLSVNGMGNSIQNLLSYGRVAYKGNNVFYANEKDNYKLYLLNTETNESTKLTDDIPYSINIYKDYIYYDAYEEDDFGGISIGIKRMKFDGSEAEVIVDRYNVTMSKIQIIDDILYYGEFERDQVRDMPTEEIIALNLKTQEKKAVKKYDNVSVSGWILIKNSNDGLDLILTSSLNKPTKIIRDVKYDETRDGEIIGNTYFQSSIAGIDKDNIYFKYAANYGDNSWRIQSVDYNNTYNITDLVYDGYKSILGDKNIYFISDDKLMAYNLESGETNKVKEIKSSYYSLFEANGYLAYYNENGEFIIDKDVKIIN